MVRLGCLRDAVQTVDIEQRTGYFDVVGVTEDVPARVRLWYQKYLKLITEGKQAPEGFQTPAKKAPVEMNIKQTPTADEPRDATEKMKKAIWAVAYGNEGNQDAQEELKEQGLNKFTVTKSFINYEWASGFLDRYKRV